MRRDDNTGVEGGIVVLGAGGHAKVVIEIAQLLEINPRYALEVDERLFEKPFVKGVRIIGQVKARALAAQRKIVHFINGVGSAGSCEARGRAFEEGVDLGLEALSLHHPTSFCYGSAKIGVGCQIVAHAVVGVDCELGRDVLVNTGAVIDHDCVIGDHCHIATGARLCGNVRVGDGVHIGAGAVVRQGVTIGNNVIVGAGAVVIEDLDDDCTAVGVPAKVMMTAEPLLGYLNRGRFRR
jgi:UDP-perosamine 4-acetyltransferase